MTGRDLIIYILMNNLEDVELNDIGIKKATGLMTVEDAAVKFDVGKPTILAWCLMGKLDHKTFGGTIYIPEDAKNPKEHLD